MSDSATPEPLGEPHEIVVPGDLESRRFFLAFKVVADKFPELRFFLLIGNPKTKVVATASSMRTSSVTTILRKIANDLDHVDRKRKG